MLSLLPAKIIKLLEWVGFSGDKVILPFFRLSQNPNPSTTKIIFQRANFSCVETKINAVLYCLLLNFNVKF